LYLSACYTERLVAEERFIDVSISATVDALKFTLVNLGLSATFYWSRFNFYFCWSRIL